jgi:hypothetical protein
LRELFEIKGNPQLNKDSFSFSENGEYPYFTRTVLNNGIAGYVDYLDEEHKIAGNCFAVGMLGMQFFYMEKDFYAGQFTKRVIPKFTLNAKRVNFFKTLLDKFQKTFQGVLVRDFENTFYNSKIQLPITASGDPDFAFMESFVAELEVQRVTELEAYLNATGLTDYTLTEDEQKALERFEKGEVEFEGFKIGGLFEKLELKFKKKVFDKANDVSKVQTKEFDLPLVNAKNGDNGVMYYGRNKDFDIAEMTLDIVNDGAVSTGNVYVQPQKTGVLYNAYLIKPTFKDVTTEMLLFFASTTEKSIKLKFGYENKAGWEKVKKEKIQIPIFHNKPDYAFMQTLISAVQKLVIADVVRYADRKIAATKSFL